MSGVSLGGADVEAVLATAPLEEKFAAAEEMIAGLLKKQRAQEAALREALDVIKGIASTLPPATSKSVLDRVAEWSAALPQRSRG